MGTYSYILGELYENEFMRRQSDGGEYIHTYASGNGALGFVVTDSKGIAVPYRVRNASGGDKHEDDFRLVWEKAFKDKGWLFGKINGHCQMFRAVTRLSTNALLMDGNVYTYAELPLKNFTEYEFFGRDGNGESFQVRNLGTKGNLRFFLENENQIMNLKAIA